MREPLVAGVPVALRLPQSRFRSPRDVIILIGGAALLAALLISVAVAHGRLLGPGAPLPSPVRNGEPAETLVGLVQVAVCAGAAAVLIAAGLHRRRQGEPEKLTHRGAGGGTAGRPGQSDGQVTAALVVSAPTPEAPRAAHRGQACFSWRGKTAAHSVTASSRASQRTSRHPAVAQIRKPCLANRVRRPLRSVPVSGILRIPGRAASRHTR